MIYHIVGSVICKNGGVSPRLRFGDVGGGGGGDGGGGESVRVKMRVPVVKAEGKGQRVEG